jgi:Domain of unknown function (DUF5011)
MNSSPVNLIRRVRLLAVLTLAAALLTAAFNSTSAASHAGRLFGGASHAKAATPAAPPARHHLAGAPALDEAAAADASVTTDKTDYNPGETVVISGSGFAAGESVTLTLHEDPARHADTTLNANADEYGNFVNKDFSPTEEHLGVSFDLKAAGQSSGRTAEAKFNDGPNWSYSSVPNPATLSVTTDGSPHTVNATVNVIAPDSGNGKPSASNVITIAPQFVPGANPIPGSWVAPLPNLTFNTSPQTLPWNVAVTVPPFTQAGSYSTMLKANPPPGKGGAGPGILITVNVSADSTPPNTTLNAAKADTTNYNGVDWTNQSVTVTLTATDSGTPTTGVAVTKYNLDGAGYQTYTGPFTVSTQALHTLLYFSQDNQGNVESPAKSFTIKIDLTKPVITLSGGDMTLSYGDTFTDPGASATDAGGSGLANGGVVTATGSVDTHTVGVYTISYNISDNAGNAADTVTRTVHVVKANQTITFGALSDKTYGAPDFPVSASSDSGLSVGFAASGNCTVSGSTIHITGAGSCTVTASQPGDSNYNPAADVPQSFNIAKADANCTVNGYSTTYNAASHTATGSCVGVGGDGTLSGLDLSNTTHTNAGSYNDPWTFTDVSGNYNNTSGSVNDQIARADAVCTINGYSGTYDGAAHGATGSCAGVDAGGSAAGGSLSLGPSFTNAPGGTANWSFTGGTNYNDQSGSVAITINKAGSTTTVTCPPGPYTYTGAAQTPCSASWASTGSDGEGASLTPSYSNNTNAGTATASASFAGDTNHNASSGSANFTINKANATISVTPYSLTYDGSAHTATGSATGVLGEPLSGLDLSGTTHTNAGTFNDSWTFTDSTGNYNDDAGSVSDQINKADAHVSVTPYSVTYDGSPHTATGSATGVVGESLSGLDLTGTTHTDAGSYSDTWTFTDSTGNYNNATGTVSDNIAKAASTTVVTCPPSVTFDGSAQTPCTASVTGAGGLSQGLSVSYANNVNAGTATASASYAGDANHDQSSDSKTFTIDKASSTTVVTCGAGPFTYNGSAQTPCSASVTGAGGLSQSLTVSYSNNTNAGTATASASYPGDANHNASSDSKNFTINKANATINVTGYTGFYDGSAHGATGTATGVNGENLSNLLNLGQTFTNVPGGTANWTFAGNNNYNSASGSVQIVINAWTANGFFSPVVPSTTALIWNNIKSGSTVPLKFTIFAGSTPKTSTSAVTGGSLSVAQVSCSDTGINVTDAIDTTFTNSGSTALRYDSTGGQFIQNWQSPSKPSTCYRVMMNAADGSFLQAFFKLTK